MPVPLRTSRARRSSRRPPQGNALSASPSRPPGWWESLSYSLLLLLDILLDIDGCFYGLFFDVVLTSCPYRFEAYVAAQEAMPLRRSTLKTAQVQSGVAY